MAKKINFNIPLKGLDNKDVGQGKDIIMLNKILGNLLGAIKSVKATEVTRQLNLALNIFNQTEEIDIDDIDKEIIQTAVTQSNLNSLIAGRILELLK